MTQLTVVLDRKELSVSMDSKTLRVNRPDGPPQRFPLKSIERLIVIGRPLVSCDVWRALAGHNIPALLLPGRGNGTAAHIGPWPASTARVRLAQVMTFSDEQKSIRLCQRLIGEKILGQRQVLMKRGTRLADTGEASAQLQRLAGRIKDMNDRSRLMGLEGAAASTYFKTIGKIIHKKWGFTGRNRRPPRDPLNSLLSLCYTMAASDMRQEILLAGLDPAIGFLHTNDQHRESLTLDALEPVRPLVDEFAIQFLLEECSLRYFVTNAQEGCRLTKQGRNRFFEKWIGWHSKRSAIRSNNFGQTKKHIISWILRAVVEEDGIHSWSKSRTIVC